MTRGRWGHAALVAACLLLPATASAQVYKCTGKDGRVQYSQTKPRDGACQETGLKPPPPIGSGSDGLMKFSDEIDQSRAEEAKVRARAAEDQAARQAACSAARRRAAALEQVSRVFSVDEQGERHYRSEAEKDRMAAEARQAVAQFCD